MLLTYHDGIDLRGLDRLDQPRLEGFLESKVFDKIPKKFSTNCARFITQTLRISPSDRMSAVEAQNHAWLCTPVKHLERFQELDRRLMADWRTQKQLRPMPYELPDMLEPATPAITLAQQDLRLRKQMTPRETYRWWEATGNSQYLESCVDALEQKVDGCLSSKPIWDTLPSSSCWETQSPVQDSETLQASGPQFTTPITVKRTRRSEIKIQEPTALQQIGPGKHLKTGIKIAHDQREQVLETLRRKNAKFLPQVQEMVSIAETLGGERAVEDEGRETDRSKTVK